MKINAADLTFGIEIECTIPRAAFNAAGWPMGGYHRGVEIPGFQGWNTQSDSSVHTRGARVAIEVVSPKLQGVDGIAQVRAMAAKLNEMGARVNPSCGFHVHVGFSGDAAALARLVNLTAAHEFALRASTGAPSRDRSHFCKSIKTNFAGLKGAAPTSMTELSRLSHSTSGDRYHVLNLSNLLTGRFAAVEFRVFSGTTSDVKMLAYVQLALGLVQKAVNVTRIAAWDPTPLSTTCARHKEGRPGATAIGRLLRGLNWIATDPTKYGIVDAASMAGCVAELKRLADKYDAPAIEAARVAAAREAARVAAAAAAAQPVDAE